MYTGEDQNIHCFSIVLGKKEKNVNPQNDPMF